MMAKDHLCPPETTWLDLSDKFEGCSQHARPVTMPVVPNIPSEVPFLDWACPSLLSENLVEKSEEHIDARQCGDIEPLGASRPGNQSCFLASYINQASVTVTKATGQVKAFAQVQERVKKASRDLRKTLPLLTHRSIGTLKASNEKGSSISYSSSPSGNNANPIGGARDITARTGFRQAYDGNENILANPSRLEGNPVQQRTPPSSEGACVQGFRIPAADICNPEACDLHPSLREDSALPARSLRKAVEESGVSESSWTKYFYTSADCWTMSHSMLTFDEFTLKNARECLVADSMQSNPRLCHLKPRTRFEDSSVASDASSGPEYLLSLKRSREGQVWSDRKSRIFEMISSTKRSNEVLSDGFQASNSRPPKFRRLLKDELHIPAPTGLEDTASSPSLSPSSNKESVQGAETSFDSKIDPRNLQVAPECKLEPVDQRLGVLQAMIPVDDKVFKSGEGGDAISTLSAIRSAGKGGADVLGSLQKQGVCA